MRILVRVLLGLTYLSVANVLLAQAPKVLHGEVTTQSAGQGLKATLDRLEREKSAGWVGYSIPVMEKFCSGCDSNGVTYLEGEGSSWNKTTDDESQPSDHALILLRVADGAVTKLRVENLDRQLDAGGLRFTWLTGVTAEDSVRVLTELARQSDERHLRDSSLFAISLHKTDAATTALIGFTAASNEFGLREKAAFWLASQRGHDGLTAIEHLAHDDADARFREKLTFDLTLSKEPSALNELIRMAHEDSSPQVRRQAQFWMATKGGKAVAADLRNIASRDADEGVRKSAVFAISRLPGDEATTQLIALADSSHDAAVRKQAVFWLGQSSDPRALEYLTKLLEHN
jgi:HEAT repeat protein